ncbi:MAG: NAD-dependent succinate-semialdehyde dehydrogenase, partial [Gammaproteobacteria bacterium]
QRALDAAIGRAAAARKAWAAHPIEARCACLAHAADLLEARSDKLARLVTTEMGKLIGEARAEVAKCAWVCRYYAAEAAGFLADEAVATSAERSAVVCQPLGTVLAVMPWNFPLWQVFRAVVPALAAGNTVLLKHASNVSLCALAIADLLNEAGLPAGVFQVLLVDSSQVHDIIADDRVHGVTFTGSVEAGRAIARAAGTHLKKCVLELGGSDAFVVLDDAEIERAADTAVTARFQNAGQSCIAAKRFIVVAAVAERFVDALAARVRALEPGPPLDPASTLAPLAKPALRDALHAQVERSRAAGARAVVGCAPLAGAGAWYQPSLLDHVQPDMAAGAEEVFGPVAAVLRVADEDAALATANASRFGLGGAVWSGDSARGEAFARALECGAACVNDMVKSDPRLPFGGIKDSGYGRELSHLGIREFVNAKSLWLALRAAPGRRQLAARQLSARAAPSRA